MNDVDTALMFAVKCHSGQEDLAGYPKILHVLRVGSMGRNLQEWILGFLHDTIEDTTLSYDELRAYFDSEILAALDAISRRKEETYKDYIQRVKANPLATRVKIKDLIDNLNRLHLLPADKANALRVRYTSAMRVLTQQAEWP
jgi:(p)ppGpp synthase/HD superfamily hydrolase